MSHAPFIVLNEKSDVPLYRQIYQAIRHAILSGELVSGTCLPASRVLAK
jgi:GntR family transcriptional regulator / MocR family aminotransferase